MSIIILPTPIDPNLVGGGGGGTPVSTLTFAASTFDNPNNAQWAVNALAPAVPDGSGVIVRAFDDTTEEGVGWTIPIPTSTTNMILRTVSRAETAPGGATDVERNLYYRELPDNAEIGSPATWGGSPQALTAISIPTNTRYQHDEETLALADLGITAGSVYQFEMTRGTDSLTDDWYLLNLEIEFT